MKNFIDTATGKPHSFDDSVTVKQVGEVFEFYTAAGVKLKTPETLLPWSGSSDGPLGELTRLGETQILKISVDYSAACVSPIEFTSASGIRSKFDADDAAQDNILKAKVGFDIIGDTPTGFTWTDANNNKIPFNLTDLKMLYVAILQRNSMLYSKFKNIKDAIRKIATDGGVNAEARIKAFHWE